MRLTTSGGIIDFQSPPAFLASTIALLVGLRLRPRPELAVEPARLHGRTKVLVLRIRRLGFSRESRVGLRGRLTVRIDEELHHFIGTATDVDAGLVLHRVEDLPSSSAPADFTVS